MAFIAENGLVSAPAFTFASDTGSGMFATTSGFSLSAQNNGLARFHSTDGVYLGYSATSTSPSLRIRNDSGTSGTVELNAYHQGVSTSAFSGIRTRHQYVTGTSDRETGEFGLRRADSSSGSQLTEFILQQRITNAAGKSETVWTNSVGDLRVGTNTYPSYNFNVDSSAGAAYVKGLYPHPDNDDASTGQYTNLLGAVATTSGGSITITIPNPGSSIIAFIIYSWWYGGNTGTAAVPAMHSFVIRNGGAGPNGHIYTMDSAGGATATETYNAGTNDFTVTVTSAAGTRPYGSLRWFRMG